MGLGNINIPIMTQFFIDTGPSSIIEDLYTNIVINMFKKIGKYNDFKIPKNDPLTHLSFISFNSIKSLTLHMAFKDKKSTTIKPSIFPV